jgi:F0F1-type ATP synthase assembly protein I
MRSFGSVLQIGSVVLLLVLIPYTLFAGFWLYRAVSSWTGGSASFLAYPLARFVACIMLIYALRRLRQTGLRLRKGNPPGR